MTRQEKWNTRDNNVIQVKKKRNTISPAFCFCLSSFYKYKWKIEMRLRGTHLLKYIWFRRPILCFYNNIEKKFVWIFFSHENTHKIVQQNCCFLFSICIINIYIQINRKLEMMMMMIMINFFFFSHRISF